MRSGIGESYYIYATYKGDKRKIACAFVGDDGEFEASEPKPFPWEKRLYD